jgi:hypothetical protein
MFNDQTCGAAKKASTEVLIGKLAVRAANSASSSADRNLFRDRGARMHRLPSRSFGGLPAQYFEVGTFNLLGNALPLVVILDALSRHSSRGLTHRWICDQKPQTIGKIARIASLEREPRALDGLAIFGNVTGQNAQTCPP